MALRSILVPVEFSLRGKAALAYAVELAHLAGARLEVLHVLPAPTAASLVADVALDRPIGQVPGRVRAHAEGELDALVASVPHDGVALTTRVAPGDPASTIARVATEAPHDLIVLCTRGRYGVAATLLGSVARTLITVAPCPVVTLRETGGRP